VPTFINAAQIINHPSFDVRKIKIYHKSYLDKNQFKITQSGLNANDLALVRTVVPIVFSANVRAVRLPNRRQVDQTFLNQQGRVSGFGATGTGDNFPNQFLRVAFAPVISQLACTIRFPNSATVNTICIEGTDINFCRGDFGGPLTIQDADQITTQIGVASFLNILGCTNGFPGGFTRVSRYLDWIGTNSDVVIRDDF
jgi:secreted trypsin-like serine protease